MQVQPPWRPGAQLAGALLLVLATLAPRLGPALAAYQPSHDAAEHLLIARALARGEGFTLPIRVRDVAGGPALHAAFEDRAPLYPLLLSLPVRAGLGASGWPDPRLSLLNVALAAAAALLAASLAAELCRRADLRGAGAALATLGAGLCVAWYPPLVRASLHLWAEPLGLALVLGAARLDLALDDRPRHALAALAGLVAALARFARPEAWVVVVWLVVRAALRRRRADLLAVVATVGLVNAAGIALTGVLAPQLVLLRVARFEDAMGLGAAPAAPGAADIARGVLSNIADQAGLLLARGLLVLPLALLPRPGAGARALLALALALVVATVAVWSTSDPHRFTIAPLALLAPVALVQAERWRRRLRSGRRLGLTLLVVHLAALGHLAARELRRRGPPPPPEVAPREGTPALADPWSYALVTGRPALYSPGAMRAERGAAERSQLDES